jgi:hypothetical protein
VGAPVNPPAAPGRSADCADAERQAGAVSRRVEKLADCLLVIALGLVISYFALEYLS